MKKQAKEKNKITKDTTISEILEYPGTEPILMKHHLPCLGCPMAQYEVGVLKIGDVAAIYGLDIEVILKELNKHIRKK